MISRRPRTTSPPPAPSPAFFPKAGDKDTSTAFFPAATPPGWAERLKKAQAIPVIKQRLIALTELMAEALGPAYTVQEKTGDTRSKIDICDFYIARGPGGAMVNFDANQQEASKTYYCNDGNGQLSTRVVLGMKALHPMGPAYTQMLNQQQQQLATGMEAKGWVPGKTTPTNTEKLQAYLSNFTNFFFSLVTFDLKTCTASVAYKFDGLFVCYKNAPEPERAAVFASIQSFYNTKIQGNTGNTIRFKIWLQTVMNDGVLTPNYLALKINELPGMKLTPGQSPAKHICP